MIGNWITGLLTDKERILAFLESDRLYASYAIGDLEPGLFAQCTWAGAEQNGRLRALGLHFRGLEPAAFFLMGDPGGVHRIFRDALHPGYADLTCRTEHMPAVGGSYAWEEEPRPMWRMALQRRDLPPGDAVCVRLGTGQAGQIRNLITDKDLSGFAPAQIDPGVFFGICADGRLVSVAGTHLVSPKYSMAGVGNIVTHPEYRGRGYGQKAVGAVLAELVRIGIRDIVLNVRQDNAPALHIYEKLGFERYCPFFEGKTSIRENGIQREEIDAEK
jgi:ribosomal protein S18 acetylase RimI-like enzyme